MRRTGSSRKRQLGRKTTSLERGGKRRFLRRLNRQGEKDRKTERRREVEGDFRARSHSLMSISKPIDFEHANEIRTRIVQKKVIPFYRNTPS